MASSDSSVGILRCKSQCYSDVTCTYWQYGTGGCWREEGPDFAVPPSPALSSTSEEAKSMLAGQHINHTCPFDAADTSGIRPRRDWKFLVAEGCAFAGVVSIAIVWFLCCCRRQAGKRGQTRAITLSARKDRLERITGPPVYAQGLSPPRDTWPQYAAVPSEPLA